MSHPAKRHRPAIKPTLRTPAAKVKTLEHDIAVLREAHRRAEIAILANETRDLNKRQMTESLGRVQADVDELYRHGIIDKNGRRISPELPKEMNGTEADVV